MQERGRMNNEKTYRLDQLIIERHATAPDGRWEDDGHEPDERDHGHTFLPGHDDRVVQWTIDGVVAVQWDEQDAEHRSQRDEHRESRKRLIPIGGAFESGRPIVFRQQVAHVRRNGDQGRHQIGQHQTQYESVKSGCGCKVSRNLH